MHSWFLLILFGSLLVQILSRPHQAEYNNDSDAEETEEEEGEPTADEFLTDEEDTRLIEQEPAVQEDEVPRSRHLLDLTESRYLQRNTAADDRLTRIKTDNLSDSKINRNRDTREDNAQARYNEQLRSYPRRRQSNKYIESNDEQEATQHLTNRDINKSNRIAQQNQPDNQVNKRTVEFDGSANEEGEMLFEKNKDHTSKVDKNEYNNNEASDANEQSRYFKQYYNAMQAENRDMLEDKGRDNARYNLRDRRDVKEANPAETPNSAKTQGNKDNNDSEDEESAIKRHIKKLSGEELDQLLSSLTDEKRELLKKIIDDVDAGDNGFINKREITKKAGAVEENNYIENCQSDLSKVQGGSPNVDLNTEPSPSQNTETTESSKQPESPTEGSDNISSSKSASETSISSVNKVELTNRNDDAAQKKSDSNLSSFSINMDPKNQGEIVANVQVSSKTENKRETNVDDMDGMSFDDSKMIENDLNLQNGQDYANDQGYFCGQDDNLSKVLDDETQFHEDSKAYKREAYSEKSDLSDTIKSLEESFPNSNAYDDTVPYSGPLVRVKRKNTDQVIKKRAAALLPDAKVGYFPYKAENDDEDNDEGNEFDDEGFYDRTSNFASGNKGLEEEVANLEHSAQDKNSNIDNSKSPHKNLEGDTMSLGSDTDSVLSGVEGVDDNLMLSSGARNRRTADENSNGIPDVKSERSTSLVGNEMKSASENYFNVLRYQENDAFGPLPRSYDGDLARYKRIRRVKQSHNMQEPTSDG